MERRDSVIKVHLPEHVRAAVQRAAAHDFPRSVSALAARIIRQWCEREGYLPTSDRHGDNSDSLTDLLTRIVNNSRAGNRERCDAAEMLLDLLEGKTFRVHEARWAVQHARKLPDATEQSR